MTTSSPEIISYECVSCEVTWESFVDTCWMCGSNGTPVHSIKSWKSVEDLSQVPKDKILKAQSLGLPDPRYQTSNH